MQGVGKKGKGVLAGVLGAIKRGIGMAQQGGGILAVLGGQGDADGGGDIWFLVFQRMGCDSSSSRRLAMSMTAARWPVSSSSRVNSSPPWRANRALLPTTNDRRAATMRRRLSPVA